jgi:hypothetical protein
MVSEIVPMPGTVLDKGELLMSVNGQVRQKSDLSKLIWSIRELIVDLSKFSPGEPLRAHSKGGTRCSRKTPSVPCAVPPK